MAKTTAKGDVQWYIPGRKRPIAYSTKATSDLIAVLAEEAAPLQKCCVESTMIRTQNPFYKPISTTAMATSRPENASKSKESMGIDKRLVKLWKENREDVLTTLKVLRQLDILKEEDTALVTEKLDIAARASNA